MIGMHNWAWEGAQPQVCKHSSSLASAGSTAEQGSTAFISSPLAPSSEHPNALGPSAFQSQGVRLFEGCPWRDGASQKNTFSWSPSEGQSCGCICNTPRFCTSTSASSGLTHCTQRVGQTLSVKMVQHTLGIPLHPICVQKHL